MGCPNCKEPIRNYGNYKTRKKEAIKFSHRFNIGVFIYKEPQISGYKTVLYSFVECYTCIPVEATNVEYVHKLLYPST